MRSIRRLGATVACLSVVLLVSCGGEKSPGSQAPVQLIEVASDHGTEWDSMTGSVTLEGGCIAFGDTLAVFPEGSVFVATTTSVMTPSGYEVTLDGAEQELIGDRHEVSGPEADDLLDATNHERLLECGAQLDMADFWVTLNM